MLTIRRKQMVVFTEAMRELLESRLESHLRSACPARTSAMTRARLRELVHQGVDRAGAHGVVFELDLRHYLELALRHGPGFDKAPETRWAGEILARRDLDGTEKINRLLDFELFVLGGGPE